MTTFLAEDFRKLVDKLNEYITVIGEEEKPDQPDDENGDSEKDPAQDADSPDEVSPEKDVDDLLTKPAGAEKLIGTINVPRLAEILSIPEEQIYAFSSGLQVLKQEQPQLNPQQAMAFATAFTNMLKLSGDEKTKVATVMRPVTAMDPINEDADESEQNGNIDDLEKVIKDAAETAPTAKLHAIKLVKGLLAGIKDRHADGGASHVVAGITDAINLAKNGDHAASLKRISDLVSHVEGDDHAINVNSFPELIVDLILLTGEMSNRKTD